MEEFCLGVFANADNADRESPSQPPDVSLAGRFYVSSLFFDVLTQFFPDRTLPPDLEEMRRYAKYRAMQIRNRQPLEEEKTGDPVESIGSVASAEEKRGSTSISAQSSSGFKYRDEEEDEDDHQSSVRPPPVLPQRPIRAAGPVGEIRLNPPKQLSRPDSLTAKKKLQQAVSAIDFSDYPTAVRICEEVIDLLTPN